MECKCIHSQKWFLEFFTIFHSYIWSHILEIICKVICFRHNEVNWINQFEDLWGLSRYLKTWELTKFFHLKCDLVFPCRCSCMFACCLLCNMLAFCLFSKLELKHQLSGTFCHVWPLLYCEPQYHHGLHLYQKLLFFIYIGVKNGIDQLAYKILYLQSYWSVTKIMLFLLAKWGEQ